MQYAPTMSRTLIDLVSGYSEALASAPHIEDLETIRDQLDSTVFQVNVAQALKGANDPELRDALKLLKRRAETLHATLDNRRELVRLAGVGGGVALIGGSLIAALTVPVVGAFALVGVFGGGWVTFRSGSYSERVTTEVETLRQIVVILTTMTDGK